MLKITSKDLKTHVNISKNINVLVGSNGSGKTRALNKIISLKENNSKIISGDSVILYNHFPNVILELNKYFEKIDKTLLIIDSNLYYKYLDKTLHISTLSHNEVYLITLMFEVAEQSIINDIILIDEVEKGLHLCWQEMMLDSFSILAPNTQFFITTHSPSILMKGYLNTFINMEDLKIFIE